MTHKIPSLETQERSTAPNNEEDLSKLKKCFVITPIGDITTDVFSKAMGLIDSVLRPVLAEFGFKVNSSNHISQPGSINNQIIKNILEDDLVIANLTGLNPNVMYELAIRHAARLPVVSMAEYGTVLPFDIKDQRTIMFNDTLAGSEIAKVQLRSMLQVAIEEKDPDNPIYQFKERQSIFKELKIGDPLKSIMEILYKMDNKISPPVSEITPVITGEVLHIEQIKDKDTYLSKYFTALGFNIHYYQIFFHALGAFHIKIYTRDLEIYGMIIAKMLKDSNLKITTYTDPAYRSL